MNAFLGGLISKGSSWEVAQLPSTCRPENALMFNVNNHQCTMRLDIYTDGKIKAITGGCHAWVSLSGVSFIRRIQSLLLVRSLHHSRAVGFRPEVSGKRHRTPWLTVSA